MEIFLSNEYSAIEYDNENRILFLRWFIPLVSAEVRESSDAIISAIGQYKTGKVVWDAAQSGSLLPEDQHWLAADWHERATAAGYSYGAYVVPEEYFSRMSFEDMLHQVENPVPYACFESIKDAVEWIKRF